jgi:hypothetical protein
MRRETRTPLRLAKSNQRVRHPCAPCRKKGSDCPDGESHELPPFRERLSTAGVDRIADPAALRHV